MRLLYLSTFINGVMNFLQQLSFPHSTKKKIRAKARFTLPLMKIRKTQGCSNIVKVSQTSQDYIFHIL